MSQLTRKEVQTIDALLKKYGGGAVLRAVHSQAIEQQEQNCRPDKAPLRASEQTKEAK